MLAPVRLAAAAPPLREASAGGWQGARGLACVNGKKNLHTLYRVQWKLWAGLSHPICFLCTLLEVDSVALTKKALLGTIHASPSSVNALLPKPVCRGDCWAVFMFL